MKVILLLSIMFIGQDPTISISEDRINRIKDAYTNKANFMSEEYNAYGTTVLPPAVFNQVPELRYYKGDYKSVSVIIRLPITVSLNGTEEFTVHTYFKFMVISKEIERKDNLYMIIAWPRERTPLYTLLRLYEYETEGRKVFLTRSALDEKLLRNSYHTEEKRTEMEATFRSMIEESGGPEEACAKAKFTTGLNAPHDYSISSGSITAPPTVYHTLVLNSQEAYLVSGMLFCEVSMPEGKKSSRSKKYLKYLLVDAERGWVLVKEKYSTRSVTVNGERHLTSEWIIDDKDENV